MTPAPKPPLTTLSSIVITRPQRRAASRINSSSSGLTERALITVAHSILVSVYYLMTRSEPYADLGPDHFDRLNQRRTEHRLGDTA